jgi:hypothetical protein
VRYGERWGEATRVIRGRETENVRGTGERRRERKGYGALNAQRERGSSVIFRGKFDMVFCA